MLPLIRAPRLAIVERFSASRFWGQVRAALATPVHYLGGILQLLLKQEPRPDDADHAARVAWVLNGNNWWFIRTFGADR